MKAFHYFFASPVLLIVFSIVAVATVSYKLWKYYQSRNHTTLNYSHDMAVINS
jgi:hypothetical protein